MLKISLVTEQLTAQFYEWELLGRGWLCSDIPIELEPPFTPFFGHGLPKRTIIDDGIQHSVLSSIVAAFKKKKPKETQSFPEVTYDLFPYTSDSNLIALRLIIPKQVKVSMQESEQLLTMLSYCTGPMSFEIIGSQKEIALQFVCRQEDAQYLRSQLLTLWRGVSILESFAIEQTLLSDDSSFATVDFGLQEEFMRPILSQRHHSDPFTGLFSILEHLQEGEKMVFQVLFNGVLNHWGSSILKSVSDAKGGAFFEDAPEMLPLAKEKIQSPLLVATMRLLVQARVLDDAFSLLRKLSFAITTTTKSSHNSLIPLSDAEPYNLEKRVSDILFRESHRSGMLLNTKELTSLIHLPDTSLLTKKITGEHRKTKVAPPITEGNSLLLGTNTHEGVSKAVTLSNEMRMKHMHAIGATGTGKSTLLQSMICQDIAKGEGVAVLDPHGDLIDSILVFVPDSRVKDVLLIDPSDSEYPVAFNILKAHSDIEKEVLSSDLVAAFRKLSTSWGDQMNSVFANAILAFLESKLGGTLADLRRFLIEKDYRSDFLRTITDPSIIYYWQKEYPLLKTTSIGPILTRLDAFLRPRIIRNMVSQPGGIDFEQVLNTKKILLVRLSQGLIGTENSYLLGSFVVSKIHQAALARQAQEKRNDFFFYIDEFQHFITPSMAHILSGARKYHLGLILAHQDLQQVQKHDAELLNTLLSNTGIRTCFRLGDSDAKRIGEGFAAFDASDLQNLGTGEAIVRIEKPEQDFTLSVNPFEPQQISYSKRETIIEKSRDRYSTNKSAVEEMLRETMEHDTDDTPASAKPRPNDKRKEPVKVATPFRTADQSEPDIAEKIVHAETDHTIIKKQETQHRYLLTLIKKVAESKGYRATIEMPTPDKKGSIDVAIEGNNLNLACEVSVTTDPEWELHNIAKCLEANYDVVFVCCQSQKSVEALKKKVGAAYSDTIIQKIVIGEADALFDMLDRHIIGQTTTETTVKGYRVKVEYDALSQEEQKKKRESVAKIVSNYLYKKK